MSVEQTYGIKLLGKILLALKAIVPLTISPDH